MQFLPAAWFRDKIVLIGSDITLVDRHRTPFATVAGNRDQMPGVVIQAHALSQLLDHRSSAAAVGWWTDFLIALRRGAVGAALGALQLARCGGAPWRLAVAIVAGWSVGALCSRRRGPDHDRPDRADAVAAPLFAAMESLTGRDARMQRKFIQGASRATSRPSWSSSWWTSPERMTLEGERREMTFCSPTSRTSPPCRRSWNRTNSRRMLNAYLDGMTEIVLKHDGMVDKFIGDAVFAIFNAPLDLSRSCRQGGAGCARDGQVQPRNSARRR